MVRRDALRNKPTKGKWRVNQRMRLSDEEIKEDLEALKEEILPPVEEVVEEKPKPKAKPKKKAPAKKKAAAKSKRNSETDASDEEIA